MGLITAGCGVVSPAHYWQMTWQGDTFLFCSELKALRAHPAFHYYGIDRVALSLIEWPKMGPWRTL